MMIVGEDRQYDNWMIRGLVIEINIEGDISISESNAD